MSPTRRDILAAIVAAPVAAVLPAATWIPNASAATGAANLPTLPDVEPHLVGYMFFRDVTTNKLVGGNFEMYSSATKAIVWLRNSDDEDRDQRLIFRNPAAVAAVQLLTSAMGNAFGGATGAAEFRNDWIMCGDCRGAGWFEDIDGNRPDCPSCRGKGYGDDPRIARERRRRDGQGRGA
jgi:hypothetical protein